MQISDIVIHDHLLCDEVYFVPTCPVFAGPVTYVVTLKCQHPLTHLLLFSQNSAGIIAISLVKYAAVCNQLVAVASKEQQFSV